MDNSVVIGLIEGKNFLDALGELSSWPESLEKDMWMSACFFWLGRYEEAAKVYSRLLSLPGAPPDVYLRLAISLQAQSRLVEALTVLSKSLRLFRINDSAPEFTELLIQYGNICLEIGLASHFLDLVSRFPGSLKSSPDLRFLRGVCFLFVGRFAQGWRDHEFRPSQDLLKSIGLNLPLLTGSNRSECTNLLIVVEPLSGFGDVFWMFRYFSHLCAAGHHLSFLGPRELVPFIASTGMFVNAASNIDEFNEKPSHWLPILGIPSYIGLYDCALLPNPDLKLVFRGPRLEIPEILQDECLSKPLIALNWQGNVIAETLHSMGIRGRSFSISDLEEIDALRQCNILSVQQGESAFQIVDSWLQGLLHPLQGVMETTCSDFLNTSDALLRVDMLITNDTSVAHLGGLLNIHTLLILKCHPYWQWGDFADYCDWYPSIRCFRQNSPGDWSGAMHKVNCYLKGHFGLK